MEPTVQEKQLAMIAQIAGPAASVLSGGALGWLVPLIIYFMKKDESKFVAFHALQAVIFQGIVFVAALILVILTVVSCGIGALLTVPLGIALGIAALVYGIMAGIKANEGQWYLLPIAGDYARKSLGV